jgi:WD40 repeat protein
VWLENTKQIVSASDDHTIKVWDLASGQCTSTLEDHKGVVNSVHWSDKTKQLVSGSDDKTIKIWDLAAGQCLATLLNSTEVKSVAWAP